MLTNPLFYVQSLGLGFALAMDAFSVSLANGLNEPCMRRRKMCGVAGMFAIFQALMPMLGWFLVATLVGIFSVFEPFIPWIALGLLAYIGTKMLIEGIKNEDDCPCSQKGLGFGALVVQGIATSIDALSVGFEISDYTTLQAAIASAIIAAVTFVFCFAGVRLGRVFGTKLACKATIFGGCVLVLVGLEIFISSFF